MTTLQAQGIAAKTASRSLAVAGTALKNRALEAIADILTERQDTWLAANAEDVAAAKEAGILHVTFPGNNTARLLKLKP